MLDVWSHSRGVVMDAFVSRRALISSVSLAAMSAGLGACGASGGGSAELSGSSSSVKSSEQKPLVQQKLESMTLEQKVAQLFIVTSEQLTGVSQAVAAGSATRRALEDMPVGGLCYFAQNITGSQQLRDLLAGTCDIASQSGAGIAPFLTVDEEGGLVARVANSGYFDVKSFSNMAEIGTAGDETKAAYVGTTIGTYLHEIGFNVDFAPVADVLTNSSNEVIGPARFPSIPTWWRRWCPPKWQRCSRQAPCPVSSIFPAMAIPPAILIRVLLSPSVRRTRSEHVSTSRFRRGLKPVALS